MRVRVVINEVGCHRPNDLPWNLRSAGPVEVCDRLASVLSVQSREVIADMLNAGDGMGGWVCGSRHCLKLLKVLT
jgi:hypothetical protein